MKERLDTLRTEIALSDTYFGFSQHTSRKILTRNDDTDSFNHAEVRMNQFPIPTNSTSADRPART